MLTAPTVLDLGLFRPPHEQDRMTADRSHFLVFVAAPPRQPSGDAPGSAVRGLLPFQTQIPSDSANRLSYRSPLEECDGRSAGRKTASVFYTISQKTKDAGAKLGQRRQTLAQLGTSVLRVWPHQTEDIGLTLHQDLRGRCMGSNSEDKQESNAIQER